MGKCKPVTSSQIKAGETKWRTGTNKRTGDTTRRCCRHLKKTKGVACPCNFFNPDGLTQCFPTTEAGERNRALCKMCETDASVQSFFTNQTTGSNKEGPAELVFFGQTAKSKAADAKLKNMHMEIRIATINIAKAPVDPTTTDPERCPLFGELLTEFVKSHQPDVLGLSELKNSRIKHFKQALRALDVHSFCKMGGVYAFSDHAQVAIFWDTATYIFHPADEDRYNVTSLMTLIKSFQCESP